MFSSTKGPTDECLFSSEAIKIGSGIGFPTLSSLPPSYLSNQEFIVYGNFTVNDNYAFNNKKFVMQAGAEIFISKPFTVSFIECDFRECTKMWKGIDVGGGDGLEGGSRDNF